MNKKLTLIFGIAFLVLILTFISAESVSTFCAEKTMGGEWCQPVVNKEDCNSSFQCDSTGCETTNYCELGTCVDILAGECYENKAKRLCEEDGGIHHDKSINELPQCEKGCCFFGKATDLMTGIKCTNLESLENIKTTFNPSITDYFECLDAGNPDVLGACTFEKDFLPDCQMSTKAACTDLKSSRPDAYFNEGYLCTAPDLLTKCYPSQDTSLEEDGKIYFLDTCDNVANIYDYDAGWNEDTESWNTDYWTAIIKPEESCIVDLYGEGQITCGNCDFFMGSTGALYEKGKPGFLDSAPTFGDYVCKDLNCPWIDKNHGDTWCITNAIEGTPANSPGSTSAVQKCFNGEVVIEDLCTEDRQELCIENEVELDFSCEGEVCTIGERLIEKFIYPHTEPNIETYAGCKENKWQDCIEQKDNASCSNSDKRDCDWLEIESEEARGFFKWEGDIPVGDSYVELSSIGSEYIKGYCVPENAPGFEFWDTEEENICSQVKLGCYGEYKDYWEYEQEIIWGTEHYHTEVVSDGTNSYTYMELNNNFQEKMKFLCSAVGDCEVKVNYVDISGTDASETVFHITKWDDVRGWFGELFYLDLKQQKKTTLVTCQPWDPPRGGDDCEKCNLQQDILCSEYQCRALGGGCEFENGYCYHKDEDDVEPPIITLLPEYLTDGYEFDPEDIIFPIENGVRITHEDGGEGCIPATKRFSFQIQTDRLATCKFNTLRTDSFEEMGNNWFDDSTGNRYNHTIKFLPSGYEEQLYSLEIEPDKVQKIFVRCENMGNGMPNVGELVFEFCVEDIPDMKAPRIFESETTTQNGASIGHGVQSMNVTFYLDEYAECKWDRLEMNYDDMSNNMDCVEKLNSENYDVHGQCIANFTGLISNSNTDENDFFIRCRDYSPNNNTNSDSYEYKLYGSIPLTILPSYTQPVGILAGPSDRIEFEFQIKTAAGSENGFADCYYRESTSSASDNDLFYETGENFHKQPYWRPAGPYNYTIECFDSAGNMVTTQTVFTVETDTNPPIVVRAFKRDNLMELITNEPAQCAYSTEDCNFDFDDEEITSISIIDTTVHQLIWDPERDLYVRCKDQFELQDYGECSIILRASEYFS